MARLLILASMAAALFLGGCATTRPMTSYVGPTVTARDAETLAKDAVDYLAEELPPGRTTLVLDPPAQQPKDALTAALMPALVARGYAVTLVDRYTGKSAASGVPVRYIASPLDRGVLLRLQYRGVEASRFYPRGAHGQLGVGAPFTVRGGTQ